MTEVGTSWFLQEQLSALQIQGNCSMTVSTTSREDCKSQGKSQFFSEKLQLMKMGKFHWSESGRVRELYPHPHD